MASKKINKRLIEKNEGRPIQTSARNRKMATPRSGARGGKGKSGK
jgi:hypothetical protein